MSWRGDDPVHPAVEPAPLSGWRYGDPTEIHHIGMTIRERIASDIMAALASAHNPTKPRAAAEMAVAWADALLDQLMGVPKS